jgi:DNA-binding NarL/FixJ family response regulator
MTEQNKSLQIGIIDDHDIVRQGLSELLANMDIQVTEEYADGKDFLNALQNDQIDRPQILLIDYSMPRLNGIEVIEKASKLDSKLKFIMLTQHFNDELKIKAYDAGARAFLNKTCTAAELKKTIDAVDEHGYDDVEEILRLLRNKNTYEEVLENHHSLTDREQELIRLVCDDQEFTYQQIADKMCLSVKSIDACRAGLFEKLNVRSKVGLVLYSFHHKLTAPFRP